MFHEKENPAPPLEESRGSEGHFFGEKIFRDYISLTPQSQLFDDDFDPAAMPIIAVHFFGLRAAEVT
jgi:hypothetical protein